MEGTQPVEESQPQASLIPLPDTGSAPYVTLLTVRREVGITLGTLKKYLAYLSIEPIDFPIGSRSLSISRRAMIQVAQLKQNPVLLAHLADLLQMRDVQAVTRDATRKEASDGY